ncbi:dihydroxyacetone kinase [Actinomyces timonensis]|uniref:Dihydroxyacetone kinase n=1 Tax=Actinomyces timonensis TaxID=1288391 RepID=A0AAU8N8P5_9ACTO
MTGAAATAAPVEQAVPAPATEEECGPVGATGASVGIVLVSHSRALAEAARDLATGLMASVSARIELAAGLADGGLGTDAAVVAAAVERLAAQPGNQGVLVIADLGSGIMSAEAALERLSPDAASRARLSPAPFVEGLIGAYGAAGIGLDLEAVAAEAARAAPAKAAQIS